MKKYLALLLTLCLALCALFVPAQADENLCELFDDEFGTLYLMYKNDLLNADTVYPLEPAALRIYRHMDTSSWTSFGQGSLPADEVDAMAARLFAQPNFRQAVTSQNNPAIRFVEPNEYVFSLGFGGDSSTYSVRGYEKLAAGRYAVYGQYTDVIFTSDGVATDEAAAVAYMKTTFNMSDEEAKASVYVKEGETAYRYWAPGNCFKMEVAFDGLYAQFVRVEAASEIPTGDQLIKPEDQPSAGVTYGLEKGMTVFGDDVFAPGTVVTSQTLTEGQVYDTAVKAVEALKPEKVTVYDLTAKLGEETVQPSDSLPVVFDLEEGHAYQLWYVDEQGKATNMNLTVDLRTNRGMAKLSHFSTYVLVQLPAGSAAPSGDVNADGKVNAADALDVLRAAVGKLTMTEAQKAAADVTGDGKINAADALVILRIAVHKQ